MSQKDSFVLGRIIRYCDDIASILNTIDSNYQRYQDEIVYQYALNMCLLQIGELVNHCSRELIEAHPDIPWKYARAMRNLCAHDYDSAQPEIVWATLTTDIPAFKAQLQALLASKDGKSTNA